MNDPSDSTFLFLVRCSDGVQGYISNAYRIYEDVEFMEFVMGMAKG